MGATCMRVWSKLRMGLPYCLRPCFLSGFRDCFRASTWLAKWWLWDSTLRL